MMMSSRNIRWPLIYLSLSTVLLIAGTAFATTFRYLSFVELVSDAQALVRARTLASESRWERGEIWTYTNFEVTDAIKGNVSRLVTVRTLGGKLGHLRSIVEGVPQFRPEEEVYLFLGSRDNQLFQVLGWAQGTFRIHRENNTGLETVTQDSADLTIFDPAMQKLRRDGIRNLPTEMFHKKINAVMNMR